MPTSLTKDSLLFRLRWEDVDPDFVRQIVGLSKIEDLAGAGLAQRPAQLGDPTSALMPDGAEGRARLVAREPMVVCGLPLIPLVLEAHDENCAFAPTVADGDSVDAGRTLGTLTGPAVPLLTAERPLLNLVQHLSGVATETRPYADALAESATTLLDTRKTLPGYRVLQKYAFACGGGHNHRMGLFDRIMLKDNHLAVAGSTDPGRLANTIDLARRACPGVPVEVEVDDADQIPPVLEAGADILLLDNFPPDALREAVKQIGGRALTEASGGLDLDGVRRLADAGLDFISTGAPIHQSRWKDIGLDWA